jgi:hypothetical protein
VTGALPVPPRSPAARLADRRIEIAAYAVILAIAAALRLVGLASRGTFDADQGHDMLILRGLVLDGRIPLLGPPTSIGDFHHGVLYYVLLAPAAAVSHADPVAVMSWIAIGGVVAVAITGWLARSIAGPVAGLLAAVLLAVSASAVEESTFIWNPNLIALSSSIALAAAWQAWRKKRAGWWVVAGGAAVVTMHCHVLGVILTPVIGGLLVADWRRRRARADQRGAVAVRRSALAWVGLGLLSYVPLAIHELESDGSELRAAWAFVASGGGAASIALPARLPIVGLRVLGWPLTGLITAAPIATVLAASLVVALAVWRGWLGGRPGDSRPGDSRPDDDRRGDDRRGGALPHAPLDDERTAVRWLAMGLAWTVVALAIGASSLATVVAGLPNDHYHAFADPIVVVLVAVGLARLLAGFRGRETAGGSGPVAVAPARFASAAVAAVILIALVGWNVATQPPAVSTDGGWPAARTAAERVIGAGGGGPFVLSSLPAFKTDEALRMPLDAAGATVAPSDHAESRVDDLRTNLVVLCDQLFRASIGADCGGPAEDAWVLNPASGLTPAGVSLARTPALVDRFEAAPGRWISIYRP